MSEIRKDLEAYAQRKETLDYKEKLILLGFIKGLQLSETLKTLDFDK